MTPRVSVIINTRNRAKIISKSITAILTQTYKDLELIVVDGNSSDDTAEVVSTFFNDPRVRYLKQEINKNAANSLNYAINNSKGSLIAFCDDDDFWHDDKLEKQMKLMDEGPENLGVVHCWEEFYNDLDDVSLGFGKPTGKGNLSVALLEKPLTGGTSLMLVKKEALEYAGLWDEEVRLNSDYKLNLKIAQKYEFDYVPEVLVKTNIVHEYGRMSELSTDNLDHMAVIELEEKFLHEFKDQFKAHPKYTYHHIKAILRSSARTGNVRKLVGYTGRFKRSTSIKRFVREILVLTLILLRLKK